jgi:repressor LexA
MSVGDAQLRVLEVLDAYHEAYGLAPSHREMCRLLGFTSTRGVHWHLGRLEEAGLVQRLPHTARAVRVTEAGRAALRARARERSHG